MAYSRHKLALFEGVILNGDGSSMVETALGIDLCGSNKRVKYTVLPSLLVFCQFQKFALGVGRPGWFSQCHSLISKHPLLLFSQFRSGHTFLIPHATKRLDV